MLIATCSWTTSCYIEHRRSQAWSSTLPWTGDGGSSVSASIRSSVRRIQRDNKQQIVPRCYLRHGTYIPTYSVLACFAQRPIVCSATWSGTPATCMIGHVIKEGDIWQVERRRQCESFSWQRSLGRATGTPHAANAQVHHCLTSNLALPT